MFFSLSVAGFRNTKPTVFYWFPLFSVPPLMPAVFHQPPKLKKVFGYNACLSLPKPCYPAALNPNNTQMQKSELENNLISYNNLAVKRQILLNRCLPQIRLHLLVRTRNIENVVYVRIITGNLCPLSISTKINIPRMK
jgi:hypothetical protein